MPRRAGLLARLIVVPTVIAAGVLVAPQSEARATDQSYWVPVDSTLTVVGHGFGHGHGMSQYGAEGAAHQGLTAAQILAFYYPGTTMATGAGSVRVLISGDADNDVVVLPATGLLVRDVGTGKAYPLPALAGVKQWRLSLVKGKEQLSYLKSAWTAYAPGGLTALVGDGQFEAPQPLTLVTGSGNRAYRGALRLASPGAGASTRATVNVLSMDNYIKGVVPREMPASWLPAAVQAQAIAARTYAVWSRNQNPNRYYQLCDTTSCQVYGGLGAEDPRSNAAVDATQGKILTWQGSAVFAQFSSSSGGFTSAGNVPYLVAKADPYDDFSGNPVHDWTIRVSSHVLEKAYPAIGRLRRIRVTSRVDGGDWSGRVGTVVLDGTKADRTVSGDTMRSLLGLRSTYFTISPTRIMARWAAIGGSASVVGSPLAREYARKGGVAQNFSKGRIFYRTGAASAFEMYGPMLTAYVAAGGSGGRLGMPMSPPKAEPGGTWATFQHGVIHYVAATRKAVVTYR